MTRPRSRLFLSAALMALVVACSGGEGGGGGGDGRGGKGGGWGGKAVSTPNQRVLVETASVETGAVADHLVTTGVLESEAQADISPETSGTVTRIYAEEGDAVRAGQVLASIENASLDAGADRASIELDKAREALGETEKLHEQGAISDSELRDARNALRVAEATYNEARASAGFTRLTSPITGTVSLRNVRVGEVAQPGAAAFQVVDLNRLRVIVQLPEKDLPRVKQGLPVTLTGAYDEVAGATGEVERVSPVVDATSGTVRVTIKVNPEGATLRPGQFVKVRVEVDRHDDVLTMPRRGLIWEDGEPIAWTVVDAPEPEAPEEPESDDEGEGEGEEAATDEEAGGWAWFGGGEDDAEEGEDAEPERDPWEGIPRRQVVKNRLEIGFVDPERVEVISGLDLGEEVVVLGNTSLRDETLVRLPGDPDPPKESKGDKGGEQAKAGESREG